MAEYIVEVDSVERDVLLDTVRVNFVSNGIDNCSFDLDSIDGSYVPSVDDPFLLKEDGVALFRGKLTSARLEMHGGPNLDSVVTRCSAVSVSVYASYRYFTGTLASGTLKSQLTTLVALLSTHGVTLHGSQVDGPTMPEMVCTRQRLDEVLNDLTKLSNYLWKIDADLKLRMAAPGSAAAPYDILDTGTARQVGDLTIEPTRDDTYFNTAILVVTGSGPATSTETFGAADGVSSGGYTRFTAKYPASQSINDAYPNVLRFDGVAQSVIGFGATQLPVDSNWFWDYTVSPAQLVYPESSGQPFPVGAEEIEITYAIGYPFEVRISSLGSPASEPIIERVIDVPQGMPLETAVEMATAAVTRGSTTVKKARFSSFDLGWRSAQGLTINVAKRNANATFIITDVVMSIERGTTWFRHDITAVEGTTGPHGNWRDVPKSWLGGGKSSSGGVALTGSAGGAVAPPLLSGQYNDNGAFGGSDKFLVDPNDEGDSYGVEALPAVLAVRTNDDRLAQAWVNTVNGIAKALTLWMVDNGSTFLEQDGGEDLVISVYGGGALTMSAVHASLRAGESSSAGSHLRLGNLLALDAIFPGCQRKTTDFTLDAAWAGGGQPEHVVILDSATPRTVTLPAVTSDTISLGAVDSWSRQVKFINIGSATWTLAPASGTIEGAASLSVATGQRLTLQAFAGTGAGYYVSASHNMGIGTGDVVGPALSVDKEVALFDGTTGKLLERATGTGIARVTSGVWGTPGNVVESEITLADNTTNDVATTKHGFAPKAPNDSTKFLNGLGAWAVPPGGGTGAAETLDFLTHSDESATLTNSRQLLAGTGITFDDTVAGERTIEASGGGGASALEVDNVDTSIHTTTAETSLFSVSVPGNALGANGLLRVTLGGFYRNSAGAGSQGFTVKVKFGGTTLYEGSTGGTAFSSNANPRQWQWTFYLGNANATNVQHLVWTYMMHALTSATTGGGDLSTAPTHHMRALTGIDGSSDTTSSQTFDVTITHTLSNANVIITRKIATAEILTV